MLFPYAPKRATVPSAERDAANPRLPVPMMSLPICLEYAEQAQVDDPAVDTPAVVHAVQDATSGM